ncbi:MAG: glycoside hydrolase family 97 protein [Pirellulaceae bacterium]|nr:glycoside hydrolase family 97 protein [Pirellulaceae bacterium]
MYDASPPPSTSCHLFMLTLGMLLALTGPTRAGTLQLDSPSGTLRAEVWCAADGRLSWSLQRLGRRVFDASPLGITVDGVDLGREVTLGDATSTLIHETFVTRGVKPQGTNHCRAYRVPVRHAASGVDWILEARLFDDGFAWRYRVSGTTARRVAGEASGWTLPPTAWAWFQTDVRNYEGEYQRARAAEIPRHIETAEGPRALRFGPPVTLELEGGGYVLISESNLRRYSGMKLQHGADHQLQTVFADDPNGFTIDGEIVSPWRVAVVVPDLDALVNSDVIASLADAPDPQLFPQGGREEWIRPGRALVTWCVFGNDGAQWHLQKWFVDQCAALHCEFLLLDGGWRSEQWGFLAGGADPWARLKELCDYAAGRGVGIVVWHAFPEGRDDGPGLTRPEARDEFFQRCHEAGVQGVKIDFFDSESREVVEAWEDLTRRAAAHHLTINFHGSNKPTGEMRTWPNHITREGLREQEYLLWGTLPRAHYAALPFTRLAAGHGDFLPGYVRAKYLQNTRAVFQMGTAVVATSPFLCWPDHPEDYRASVFLGLVQAMPVLWDETHVLAGSEIGRRVAFARRAGREWFIAALNCDDQE